MVYNGSFLPRTVDHVIPTLTSSGVFLVPGVGSCTRWGTGSDRGTAATAADAQRWDKSNLYNHMQQPIQPILQTNVLCWVSSI